MPELRKDPVVKRWVIIATERAKRPNDFKKSEQKKEENKFCVFCYGNEHLTPPEIMAFRPEDTKPNESGWWVRVVDNKFPALNYKEEVKRSGHGMYDMMSGFGKHEVIIETPNHDENLATIPYKQMKEVVWAYVMRYRELSKDKNLKYILIFKNYKREAGASLSHPHSQIIATPIVPKRVAEELNGSKQYYDYKERCVFCDIIAQEKIENKRIVEENDDFIAFTPYASRFPYEIWILPKRHMASFGDISDEEVESFSRILKNTGSKLINVLGDPPFNYVIHSAPVGEKNLPYYHWHLEIMPRLTKTAGFEWGSGFYINPVPPESAAESLNEGEEENK
jgi:UDPglucose--hexose-1-phosphate uridylyltransferase